jgi:hypothetical protein
MAAQSTQVVFNRAFGFKKSDLEGGAAQAILQLAFTPSGLNRIQKLSKRAREGTLTPDEARELDGYLEVGRALAVVQSKARSALKSGATSGATGRRRAS